MRLFLFGIFLSAFAQAAPLEELQCWGKDLIRVADNQKLSRFESNAQCEEARQASQGGVVCLWFTPGMPIGPEGWEETGWRPTNIETRIGLGRKAISDFPTCLGVTANASGGIVCTNTGLGFKPTNIETNLWCGASSQHLYCTQASQAAVDFEVCSFPSEGSGVEAGWVRTKITDTCEYSGSKATVENCNATLPMP